MKKFLNHVTTSLLFSLIILITLTLLIGAIALNCQSHASADIITSEVKFRDAYVQEDNLDSYYDLMNTIENEMDNNNTSVIEILQDQIDKYENMLVTNTYNNRENIETIIKVNKEMIASYLEFENSKLAKKAWNTKYSPVISAAKSYFDLKGYILSSECLVYAWENEKPYKRHSLEHTNIIEMGTKFKEISFGNSTSGSSIFEFGQNNTTDQDLAYSIHEFSYTKTMPNSRTVKIIDTYDFREYPNPQDTFEEILQKMYEAQELGILVPFKIEQAITPTTGINLTPGSTYKETFDIAKTEMRLLVLVINSGTKINVTFSDIVAPMYVDARSPLWENDQRAVSNSNSSLLETSYDCSFTPISIILMVKNNTFLLRNNTMTITISCE